MHSLDFTICEKTLPPGQIDPPPTQEKIHAWVDKLALVNPGETSQRVNDYLEQLIRADMPAQQLYTALEALRLTVTELTETLRPKYAHANLPLSERNRVYFGNALRMQHHLICGYNTVLHDGEQEKQSAINKKIILHSLFHAIHHLSIIMQECYLVYLPIPANTWQTMHQLYLVAEDHEILDTVVPISDDKSYTETINLAYKRAILLSLANPYHLMQDEVGLVFRFLGKLSQGIQILRFPEDQELDTGFAIDLQSDRAPVFINRDNRVRLFKPRELRLTSLLEALNLHVAKLEATVEEAHAREQSTLALRLRRDLLNRLEDSWARNHERQHERESQLGQLELIIGLSTTHYHASNKVPFNPELDEIKSYAGALLAKAGSNMSLMPKEYEPWKTEEAEKRLQAGIDNPRSSNFDAESAVLDTWEKIYAVKPSRDSDEITLEIDSNKYKSSTWDLRNISRGGMSLFCQSDRCMPVRVGELIAYRENMQWALGVIRWLHSTSQLTLELGVMSVARRCMPVAARAVKGTGKGGEYMRCLMLDEARIDAGQSRLIVPTAIYDTGTELVLNMFHTLLYAELTKQTFSTKSVSIYEFKLIDRPEIETQRIEAIKELL